MTGIFGFYSFGEERERWNGLRFLYYGLQALQGRGSESVSLAWLGPNGFETYSTEGDVDAIRYLVEKSRGHIAMTQLLLSSLL
jgi:glutamine phosphoribosylpyrophosphate amidotransferase